ncbi:radical SAM family heme chaperone HemW, partial [Proteiniclasticum ruminis]
SFLSKEELERLGKALRDVRKTDDVEFTMECNPGNITKEKAEVIKKMGVNRLSIGLQSSNDSILLDIGRIHTFKEFEENYKMLRELGFMNINIDLIYGLPHENLKILQKTLSDVAELNPEHISCYSLIIEEFTPFYYRAKRNELFLPDEETERKMNEIILRTLSENGYERYEISNYAKDGKYCRHNIRYWSGEDYIGAGTSSHEYFNGERQENIKTVEGYIRLIRTTGSASVRRHENTKDEEVEEYVFMGMRMMRGLNKKKFEERFQRTIESYYENSIQKHIKSGLLIDTPEVLRFTQKGIEFSNHVLSDFLLSV